MLGRAATSVKLLMIRNFIYQQAHELCYCQLVYIIIQYKPPWVLYSLTIEASTKRIANIAAEHCTGSLANKDTVGMAWRVCPAFHSREQPQSVAH